MYSSLCIVKFYMYSHSFWSIVGISIFQKYTHMKNDKSESQKHYLRKPLWWIGFVLMVLGEVGNFSAYGFAPASLVAPLGTTTVIGSVWIHYIRSSVSHLHVGISWWNVVYIFWAMLMNYSQHVHVNYDSAMQPTCLCLWFCHAANMFIAVGLLKERLRPADIFGERNVVFFVHSDG